MLILYPSSFNLQGLILSNALRA
jgi:hypothetical protein